MTDRTLSDPDMAKVEAMLRTLEPDDLVQHEPPTDVWDGIRAQLEAMDDAVDDLPSNVVRARFGRRIGRTPLLAVAAAFVVIIAGVAVVTTDSSDTTTVAAAELAYDAAAFDPAGADAAATAELVDDDGNQLIRLDDDALPFDLDEDAALELWLIQADAAGNVVDLVSLGDIDADGSRTFAVPAGYDADVYSVVDISIEPRDGDEAHSGRSILRGALA